MLPGVNARPAKLELYRRPEVAADYDQRWRGRGGARRQLRKQRAVAKALAALGLWPGHGRPLLDAPCGTGRLEDFFIGAGFAYVGTDLSMAMLRQSRSGNGSDSHDGASKACADLLALPFADHAVEVSVCVRFLHLVRDPQDRIQVLKELNRVSSHGVVLNYQHNRTLRYWNRRLRYKLGQRSTPPSQPSVAQIKEEVQQAGLDLVAWIPVHLAPGFSDKVVLACRSKA